MVSVARNIRSHLYSSIIFLANGKKSVALTGTGCPLKFCLNYNDIQRSDGDVGLHCLESDREHHHYKLGLEVLRVNLSPTSC